MATITTTQTKVADQTLLTIQAVAGGAVVKSAELDVSTKESGLVFVRHGRTTTTTLPASEFRLESSPSDSGNDWQSVWVWQTGLHGTASVSRSLSVTAAAGAQTLSVDTTGGIANGDDVLIYHSGAVGASEFAKAATVTSPNAVLTDSLGGAHTAGAAVVTDNAEQWAIPLDLQGIRRLRIVIDNAKNAVGQSTVAQAKIVTTDSYASV